MNDDPNDLVCLDIQDGRLVFESRETQTDEERERADLHLSDCPACRVDLDFDFLMNRLGKNNSRC